MANIPQATQKTVKILVVEDSPTQLEALRFLLEESGFLVVTATNGREGFTAAKASTIDLVISDIVMPEMDGYTLCKKLRAEETLRHIPVILLTSLSDPRDVIQGLEAGASNFLCKPYEDGALLARVQNVLTNLEIRKDSSSEMGINIFFAGQRFFITADRLQILDLLLSTYENAVNRNSELMRTRDELHILNEKLEARVAERTATLAAEVVERKKSQEREHHLNRLLRTIRNVNQLIVREKDPARLIEQACELLVKTDGYHAAWIALDSRNGPISLVAQAGWGESFEPFREKLGQGLIPQCFADARSSEKGITVFNSHQDCCECLLLENLGHSQSCIVPIRHGIEEFGTLGFYLMAGTKIDDDETELLLEVAHDLGLAMHGIMTDKARKESEEKLQVITDSAPDAVILKDGHGRISYWNPASERVFGYSKAEAMGRKANELLMPERVRPQYKKVIDKFRKPGSKAASGTVIEFVAKHKDGHEFPIEMAVSAIPVEDKFWVSMIIRDITDRKRAEQELRESETRYRTLFDTSRDCVFISSLNGRWLYVNEAAVELFGYSSREELSQMNIEDIYANPEERAKYIHNITERGFTKEFPVDLRRKNGSIIHALITAVPRYDPTGNITGFQGTVRDITERKQAEEKIKNSLAEKEVLLKEVHHRVKNNLMIIIGLIKMQETKADEEMFNPLLQELEGRIRAMAQVHENLYLSKYLTHIDLQNYIETISAQINGQFGSDRNIHFSVQAAGVMVSLDKAISCGLILNELITNACKHAFPVGKPGSGAVRCEINVTAVQDGGELTLTVANNGGGLPSDFDLENSETLGLRLISMLTKQINGSIELDRSVGTAFRLKFPLA